VSHHKTNHKCWFALLSASADVVYFILFAILYNHAMAFITKSRSLFYQLD